MHAHVLYCNLKDVLETLKVFVVSPKRFAFLSFWLIWTKHLSAIIP